MSDNIICLNGEFPKRLIGDEVLASKIIILTGLCQNEILHHKLKIRFHRFGLGSLLETRRSHDLLGVVVPIREVRVVTPLRIVGFRVRDIPLVMVHKVGTLLDRSSHEDHLKIYISKPINSSYLIVECSGEIEAIMAGIVGAKGATLRLFIF